MRIVTGRQYPDKLNLIRDPMAAAKWRAEQKQECMCCGVDGLWPGNHLQVHHLAGAAGRSDEPCNFLLVCRRCHEDAHAYLLGITELLAAKQLCDPSNYNKSRVMKLMGRIEDAVSDSEIEPLL